MKNSATGLVALNLPAEPYPRERLEFAETCQWADGGNQLRSLVMARLDENKLNAFISKMLGDLGGAFSRADGRMGLRQARLAGRG